MKISVISDCHLGFGYNTERSEDAFDAFQEALEKSLDSDIILLGGDIFDSRIPRTEVLTKAMELLIKPLKMEGSVTLESGTKDISELPRIRNGIPVISIHGNHERRVKGLLNPVEALEKAGFLVHLHCNHVILQKDGEKIAIHGMSGVPDQYAESVLKEWNPRPVEGYFNILITHQSIAPFVYAEHLLYLEKLPTGFDLYINGHIHDHKKSEHAGKPFIIPGSLLPTQITKDACHSGMCKLEISGGNLEKVEFIELENQRKMYYLEFDKIGVEELENEIKKVLSARHKLKPIIRVKIGGKHMPTRELMSKFEDRAILSFKIKTETDKIDVKSLQERTESIQEMSRRLLSENLSKFKLDKKAFENIFELLNDNKPKEAEKLLLDELIENQDGNYSE